MRKRPPSRLQPLSPMLDTMFQGMGITEKIRLEKLRRKWSTIFSGPLSDHTSPSDIKDGLLFVSVDSPSWLQHLKFMQKEVAEKLRPHGIKAVRFRHGVVYDGSADNVVERESDQVIFRDLSESEKEELDSSVAAIEDPELKEAIRQTFLKSVSRKR